MSDHENDNIRKYNKRTGDNAARSAVGRGADEQSSCASSKDDRYRERGLRSVLSLTTPDHSTLVIYYVMAGRAAHLCS